MNPSAEMQNTLTIPSLIRTRVVSGSLLIDSAVVLAASAVLAISAQIAIPLPFTPIPMTMQPLALLLIGATLGAWRGAVAAALYLAEGAVGLPVFSMSRGGMLMLLGPTAGFLYAFPAAAWIAGRFSEKGWTRSVPRTFFGMAVALAVLHLGGWSWLAGPMGLGAARAFTVGIAPFLTGDIVKLAIAAILLPAVQHTLRRR